MTDLHPIRFVAVRWKCPHCQFSRSKEASIVDHMTRCWQKPENRACKTCANFFPSELGGDREDFVDELCGAGCNISGGLLRDCPEWESNQ